MSTGSGFGTGGGSGRENRGDDPWAPSTARPSEPDEQATTYTTPRADRSARPPGQERTVSYQPEERYWTDYLRVALPVVGLLLMLGLFLFWANQLIDPGGDATEPPVVVENPQGSDAIAASPPVATATAAPDLAANAGTDAAAQPTTASGQDAVVETATSAPDAPEATETVAGGDGADTSGDVPIEIGQDVQTNDDTINIREEATTSSGIVATLNAGQQMTVVAGPTNADNYDWYQVEFQDADNETVQGWVASDFIEPS